MTVKYDRDVLLNDLTENVCEVYFTKVNGEKRAMRCSLRPDVLPESYTNSEAPKVKDFHTQNKDVLAVWDLQNAGWRSFRVDSVEYVQVIDNY